MKSDSSNADKNEASEDRPIAITATQYRGRSIEAPKVKAPDAGRDKSANSVDQLFKMMRQENRLKKIANAKVVSGDISLIKTDSLIESVLIERVNHFCKKTYEDLIYKDLAVIIKREALLNLSLLVSRSASKVVFTEVFEAAKLECLRR
jgi:hypothetical protein